jgi:hypothetical protein
MAYKQTWGTADPATRRAWAAIRKMKTEEEVQRVEELLQGRPHATLKVASGLAKYCGISRTRS